ncbi:unnamed protein product [Aspergillus oryzae]|uniref:Unnamed protein product n=1 Tax=Aspergillus oryzae TaxID=5062 RepID=A0AAN5BWN3_ASPOZ|nr:unnamed protein product [Aspergillus oryzae]
MTFIAPRVSVTTSIGILEISLTKVTVSLLSGCRFVAPNRQTIDTQEGRDPVDDQECPVHIDDKGKEEIHPQVQELHPCAHPGKTNPGQVHQNSTANQRCLQDGPMGEWLSQQMRKNDLCSHPSKDERDCPTVQHQAVISQYSRIRREEPSHVASSEDDHWHPLLEDRGYGEILFSPRTNDIVDTTRQMSQEER